MAISKIFVANSGEIAVRIIGGPRLGIETVQALSAADGGMVAVRRADETVPVRPGIAAQSALILRWPLLSYLLWAVVAVVGARQ
jgi:acetyl/propionyl-CoA carboxylase alpha subunit